MTGSFLSFNMGGGAAAAEGGEAVRCDARETWVVAPKDPRVPKRRGFLGLRALSVPVATLPSPPLPRVPAHRYCASLWRVRLAQRRGSLDLRACRGRLVGGGHERCQRRAGGGRLRRGASPLLVGHVHKADGERAAGKSWPTRGRRGVRVVCSRCGNLCWSVLDEKRMTGESVNFRLNQMDFVAFILHA